MTDSITKAEFIKLLEEFAKKIQAATGHDRMKIDWFCHMFIQSLENNKE